MSKIDYVKHQSKYLALLVANPSLTVAQYCEQSGLKYASARRYIKRPTKDEIKAMTQKATAKAKPGDKSQSIKDKKARSGRSKAESKWAEHVRNFLSRGIKNPALKMTVFAQEEGIVIATFRREVQKFRKQADFDQLFDLYDKQLAQFRAIKARGRAKSSDSSRGKQAGSKRPATGQSAQNENQNGSSGDPVSADDAAIPSQDAQSGQGSDVIDKFSLISSSRFAATQNLKSIHSSLISGNGRKSHGGYCKGINIVSEMLDTLTKVDPLSVSDELLVARARYYRMNMWIETQIQSVHEHITNGTKPKDSEGEDMDPDRVMKELIFAYEPRLSQLEFSITNMVSLENKRAFDHRKQLHEEMKMPHYLPAEETALVVEVLSLRDRYGWDALTTAQNIEKLGAKVPPALMLELKDEIDNAEPEILDGELSPEEFERRQIEYFEGLEGREGTQQAEKQQELDAIFAEFGSDSATDFQTTSEEQEESDE